jgi:hypothetical protein
MSYPDVSTLSLEVLTYNSLKPIVRVLVTKRFETAKWLLNHQWSRTLTIELESTAYSHKSQRYILYKVIPHRLSLL